MNMIATEKRIEVLDAFRFLAVTAVVLYHYYSYWTPPSHKTNMYPYGDMLADYFRYGYLGVQFFFIISGFVIFFTLENSKSLFDFFKRRASRLFPPMLLSSIVIMLFVFIADPSNYYNFHRGIQCLLPSLTFTKPEIWNNLFHTNSFEWVSAVHWSLWHEVQFYVLSGILFFTFKRYFVRVYAIASVTLIASYWVVNSVSFNNYLSTHSGSLIAVIQFAALSLKYIYGYFDVPSQLGYFSIGIFVYLLYNKRNTSLLQEALFLFIVFFQFYAQHTRDEKSAYVILIAIFTLFILNSKVLDLINISILKRIGVISYSFYLIHSEIGLILINKLAAVFPLPTYIVPILVYVLMVLFAELSFRFYEKKAALLINNAFDKARLKLVRLRK